ncbi:magnesium transporter [Pyrococcus kukulkanii]|uniref:magnesium transporter n=1 Tax=Pyrococcus kukulkanii TaxID=1609559 RepID=UPI0035674C09
MATIALQKLKESIRYTFPALLLCLVLDFVGGTFLGVNYSEIAKNFPIILVILPGLMDLRGNVFGTLASRLTTKLNLGIIKGLKDRELKREVLRAIFSSKIPLIILWIIGVLHTDNLKTAVAALLVVILSALVIGIILGYSAALITVVPYSRGFDPDRIAAPLITSISDIVTIPTLIFFLKLYLANRQIFYLLFFFTLGILMWMGIKSGNIIERSFTEIAGILTLLALIESFAGSLLEQYSSAIGKMVLLAVLYPSILDSLGNMGSVIVARLSTRYHLEGEEGVKSKDTFLEILAMLLMSVPLIVIANVMAILIVELTMHVHSNLVAPLILGYPLIALAVMIIGATLVLVAPRIHLDPDNLGVPLITTIADVLGTIFVVALALH